MISTCSDTQLSHALLIMIFLYIFTFHNSLEVEVCFDLSYLLHFPCSFKCLVLVFVAHYLFWSYASIYSCGLQLLVNFLCYWDFVVLHWVCVNKEVHVYQCVLAICFQCPCKYVGFLLLFCILLFCTLQVV